MKRALLLAACLVAVAGAQARADSEGSSGSPFLDNPAEVEKFVAQRRAEGPEGLAATLQILDAMKAGAAVTIGTNSATVEDESASPDACSRFGEIVDQVAGLRGATVARLYWYTDLEQAKAAAVQSGKPILSLRMLGKLTDGIVAAASRRYLRWQDTYQSH
jgi:hypothetical protein